MMIVVAPLANSGCRAGMLDVGIPWCFATTYRPIGSALHLYKFRTMRIHLIIAGVGTGSPSVCRFWRTACDGNRLDESLNCSMILQGACL